MILVSCAKRERKLGVGYVFRFKLVQIGPASAKFAMYEEVRNVTKTA